MANPESWGGVRTGRRRDVGKGLLITLIGNILTSSRKGAGSATRLPSQVSKPSFPKPASKDMSGGECDRSSHSSDHFVMSTRKINFFLGVEAD